MTRSTLIYRDDEGDSREPIGTIIGLHGRGGDLGQFACLCRDLGSSFRLVTPQAARALTNTMLGALETDGFTWYLGEEVGRPEPATFGESLWQCEQFILGVEDRQRAQLPIFLVGYGQGAVLALALAGVVPESLAGVVAISGYYPYIRGWSLPVQELQRLPILLINDPADSSIPHTLLDRTVEEFRRRRAIIELQNVSGSGDNLLAAAGILKQWLALQLVEMPHRSGDLKPRPEKHEL
jgi:predicted esterase